MFFKKKKFNEQEERAKMLELLGGVPKEEAASLKSALGLALADLHGTCSSCANYTVSRNEGPCHFCCYETERCSGVEVNDNWVWRHKELYGI